MLVKRSVSCLLIGVLGVWVLATFGCEKEGSCGSIYSSTALVRFYDQDGNVVNLTFDSVYAIGADSIFYDSLDFLPSFGLPVNPFSDTTAFIFARSSNDTAFFDTLVLSYRIRQQFISRLCGVEQTFTELRIDAVTFDSTSITNDSLLVINDENVRIFY